MVCLRVLLDIFSFNNVSSGVFSRDTYKVWGRLGQGLGQVLGGFSEVPVQIRGRFLCGCQVRGQVVTGSRIQEMFLGPGRAFATAHDDAVLACLDALLCSGTPSGLPLLATARAQLSLRHLGSFGCWDVRHRMYRPFIGLPGPMCYLNFLSGIDLLFRNLS